MYFLKTHEQRKRENRQALIIVALVFGVSLMFVLIITLFTKESSDDVSNKRGSCATMAEPYNYVEHNVYCDGDYDWVDAMVQEELIATTSRSKGMKIDVAHNKLRRNITIIVIKITGTVN